MVQVNDVRREGDLGLGEKEQEEIKKRKRKIFALDWL